MNNLYVQSSSLFSSGRENKDFETNGCEHSWSLNLLWSSREPWLIATIINANVAAKSYSENNVLMHVKEFLSDFAL